MSAETFSLYSLCASRRVAALVVVALHLLAIYALTQLTYGSRQPTQLKALQVAIVAEERTPDREILPPPPTIATSPVMVDMPLISLPNLPEPQSAITVALRTPSRPAPSATALPKLISAVEYIRQPLPQYPLASRRLREEGLVMLRVLIDERGKAVQIELHRSSGHERLDRAACEAVAHAKFKPYIEDGVAQLAFALVPIEFTLNQRVAQR